MAKDTKKLKKSYKIINLGSGLTLSDTHRKTDKNKPKEQIYDEAINRSKAIEAKKKKFYEAMDDFIEEATSEYIRCIKEKEKPSVWSRVKTFMRAFLP